MGGVGSFILLLPRGSFYINHNKRYLLTGEELDHFMVQAYMYFFIYLTVSSKKLVQSNTSYNICT